ncbi:hypothetical protein GGD40_001675 [Paraburkholderia bryophila]|uniref:Killing trait domain-containing protein n=1 Tax=Paraburkholderia bryophila TaxID=420952 RepID=A0A7Y9WJU9_9BURK|nr:hypothetical protein [Paraburkholderia bryophila]
MSSITTTSVSTATASVQNPIQPAAPFAISGSTGSAAMNVSSLVSSLVAASALANANTAASQPAVNPLPDSVSGDSTSA